MRPLFSGAFPRVTAGLDPAIHVFAAVKTWMPGTSPGMTLWKTPISLAAFLISPSDCLVTA
jgi:hypothetical protein